MKKYIVSILLGGSLMLSSVAYGTSVSQDMTVGQAFQLLTTGVKVTAITVVASTATNAVVGLYDIPALNQIVSTNAAYTNVLSYGTNLVWTYTNYFGATQLLTNFVLVDITNHLVALSYTTNSTKVSASAPLSTTAASTGLSYQFNRGLAITNLGAGNVTAIITYQ